MLRALVFTTLAFIVPLSAAGQTLGVLHIKVVLIDADGKATPVPRHALLISDNPASAAPRRIVTAPDGTASVKLRPGNYTVESDRPVAFQGKAYQWAQTLDVAADRESFLELTTENAEIGPVTAEAAAGGPPPEADVSALLMQWQDSVVAIWTPTTRASGFVIDAKGLVATSQRSIGAATTVEVQLTSAVKVAGSVLVADPARDVAILWIDPKIIASVRPVPLGCSLPAGPTLVDGQEVFAIGVPMREPKSLASGDVRGVGPRAASSDLRLARGSAGGPVFAADGGVIGITSVAEEKDDTRRGDVRIVRAGSACEAVTAAETKMTDAAPPSGVLLPVEPARPFPVDAMKDAARRRAGNLNAYRTSSSEFDILFITPVLVSSTREDAFAEPMDFGRWSDYVEELPVLLVRVTPKQVEGFWTTVARGAAQTQGVALPPMKRHKTGFSRMRAFCGDAEVTPIHPFTLGLRVSDTETIDEGLYVFDPGALGPHCGTVKVVLYSAKEPEKGDTRVVDPKVIQQIWQDFTPYRDQK